jgi:hypothetical protein
MSKLVRNLGILAIAIATVAAVFSRYGHARPDRRIDLDTYKRIENGMTLKQVSDLIGGWPDWTSSQGVINNNWAGDRAWIKVGCDNNRVVSKRFIDAPVPGSEWADDWRRGLLYMLRSFDPSHREPLDAIWKGIAILAFTLVTSEICIGALRIKRAAVAGLTESGIHSFRRRSRWIAGACLVIIALLLFDRFVSPPPGNARQVFEKYDRIRRGMPEALIQSFLGGEGLHAYRAGGGGVLIDTAGRIADEDIHSEWIDGRFVIHLQCMDYNGGVTYKSLIARPHSETSFECKLRDWFAWLRSLIKL